MLSAGEKTSYIPPKIQHPLYAKREDIGLRSTETKAPNVGLHIGPNDGFTSATADRFGWDLSRSIQFLGRFVAGNWGISLHIPVFGYDPLTNHLAKSSDLEVVLNSQQQGLLGFNL